LFSFTFLKTFDADFPVIVMLAKASIQVVQSCEACKFAPAARGTHWIPGCAGMTMVVSHLHLYA
jgi:hypothetical protein